MGLSARIRRWRYVYGWRLRYWWLDTPAGRHAQITTAVVLTLGLVAGTVRAAIRAMTPAPTDQPQHAVIGLIVWIVVALVVAIIAVASMPKPKDAPQQTVDAPVTDDGQPVLHAFGTVWIDDSFLLAWMITGRDPIKSDGGKK